MVPATSMSPRATTTSARVPNPYSVTPAGTVSASTTRIASVGSYTMNAVPGVCRKPGPAPIRISPVSVLNE